MTRTPAVEVPDDEGRAGLPIGAPAPFASPRGTYSMLVRCALLEAGWVEVWCVHGDIHKCPIVPLSIKSKDKTHRIKTAVVPEPLILGPDWVMCGDAFRTIN